MTNDLSALIGHEGKVRLFPLPNLVMFPHVMQPLHIFEPRYRQMVGEALEGDRLITMALLKPGWEADYAGRPAIHSAACLGQIVADQRLEDGRFNILLRGLSRVQLAEEPANGKLFRTARANLLQDTNALSQEMERTFREQLAALVPLWFADQGPALAQFHKLLAGNQPLTVLADILAFALALDVEAKQELLELLSVERRLQRLVHHMTTSKPAPTPEPKGKFPPQFSSN